MAPKIEQAQRRTPTEKTAEVLTAPLEIVNPVSPFELKTTSQIMETVGGVPDFEDCWTAGDLDQFEIKFREEERRNHSKSESEDDNGDESLGHSRRQFIQNSVGAAIGGGLLSMMSDGMAETKEQAEEFPLKITVANTGIEYKAKFRTTIIDSDGFNSSYNPTRNTVSLVVQMTPTTERVMPNLDMKLLTLETQDMIKAEAKKGQRVESKKLVMPPEYITLSKSIKRLNGMASGKDGDEIVTGIDMLNQNNTNWCESIALTKVLNSLIDRLYPDISSVTLEQVANAKGQVDPEDWGEGNYQEGIEGLGLEDHFVAEEGDPELIDYYLSLGLLPIWCIDAGSNWQNTMTWLRELRSNNPELEVKRRKGTHHKSVMRNTDRPNGGLGHALVATGKNDKRKEYIFSDASKLEHAGFPPGAHNMVYAMEGFEKQTKRLVIVRPVSAPIPKYNPKLLTRAN